MIDDKRESVVSHCSYLRLDTITLLSLSPPEAARLAGQGTRLGSGQAGAGSQLNLQELSPHSELLAASRNFPLQRLWF